MNKEEIIAQLLLLPFPAIDYHVGLHLREAFPEKVFIEVEDGNFQMSTYAKAGKCVLTQSLWSYNQSVTYWDAPEPEQMSWHAGGRRIIMGGMVQTFATQTANEQPQEETGMMLKKGWTEVEWEGEHLDVMTFYIDTENCGTRPHYWLLADEEPVARRFLAAVCAWNAEIRSEVLVFDMGRWYKDEKLFQNIRGITFDSLILKGDLKKEILNDLEQFFALKEVYEEHDIPWKRGILFLGPAGNGKTHTVKALINSLNRNCLYVKSFRAPHTQGADEVNIRQVFERARRSTPCVLILEDLDSLITPQNRSFFLNELDGFAANIGIVTVATTNHPERLDPAILNRPSRFDRKYHFDLPELVERLAYIALWNEAFTEKLRLSPEAQQRVSEPTEGFSFAYLKELFLSSKMRWIAQNQQRLMEEVMEEQVQILREQMTSAPPEPDPNDEASMLPGGMHGGMFLRGRMRGPFM